MRGGLGKAGYVRCAELSKRSGKTLNDYSESGDEGGGVICGEKRGATRR